MVLRGLAEVNTAPYVWRMTAPRLTPEDWIAAAFRRLGKGGIASVRAEAVARDLGVSKGSFYWHFKDLPDLRRRMLGHWEDQGTARIITLTRGTEARPAAQQLRALLELATSDLADPYGGLSTEAAIRDWARTDPLAAQVQTRADQTRLAFLTGLLQAMGQADDQAARVARLTLMAYTGAVHRGITDRADLLEDLTFLIDRLTRG